MWYKLFHIFFLSCLKATELIEKNLHVKLSFKERIQLRVHRKVCDACARYEEQSKYLEKGISNLKKQNPDQNEVDVLKKRISQKLEESEA